MERIKTIFLLSASLLIVPISCRNDGGSAQVQPQAKRLPLVSIQSVQTGRMISYIDITGTIEANILTEVTSPVNGIITELHARENQRTVKDRIIAVISPNDRVALIASNQLGIEELEKRLSSSDPDAPEHEYLAAELNKARGNLKYALEMYQPVPVICPMNGVVTSRWVEEGSQVAARDRIVTISDMSSLVIKAEVNEKYFEAVTPGRRVPVVLNAYSADSLTGVISLVYPSVSSDSRSVKFDVRIQGFSKKLVPGMMATLKIPVYTNDKALMVNDDAILTTPDNRKFLFVVGSDSIAQQRFIRSGVTVNGQTEITDGIREGENVVISGQEALRNNVKVAMPSTSKNLK